MKTCESNRNLVSYTLQGAGGVGVLLAVTESSTNSLPPTAYYPAYGAIRLRASLITLGQDGNITEYADTNGTIVAHYEYNPFGGLITSSGTKANDFKFRFSTKYFNAETGLYYYGYRFYSSELGRWINRDPIGEEGAVCMAQDNKPTSEILGELYVNRIGENGYVFVQNTTINAFDPDGRFWFAWFLKLLGELAPIGEEALLSSEADQQVKGEKKCATEQKKDGCSCCVMVIKKRLAGQDWPAQFTYAYSLKSAYVANKKCDKVDLPDGGINPPNTSYIDKLVDW